jgi:hypothetical protein
LPFLKFTRDSRGYESTFLMHAFRRRGGKARQRILYWFRTPPNVKVGRAALDEDAIRWIEEHNPDVAFDWPKILEVRPPTAPASDEPGRRRGKQRGARPRPSSPEPAKGPEPELQDVIADREIEAAVEPIAEAAILGADTGLPAVEATVAEEPTRPAVDTLLTREQLISFRARFAELQARITERASSPEQAEVLRAQAESLNPDTWVTEEDVRRGLAQFEPQIRELRAALGLRRRRRSRRGGRRHRRPDIATTPQPHEAGTDEADPEDQKAD